MSLSMRTRLYAARAISGRYQASPAQERARARRWTGARLERDEGLRERVLAGLKWGGRRSRSPMSCAEKRAGR